jgi:hypothetical protein
MQALNLGLVVQRMFRQAWERYGRPVMWAVKPIANWTLPQGFAYNPLHDAVQNTSGIVLPNPEDYWAGDYINIVPLGVTADLRALMAGGLVEAGTVEVRVLVADLPVVRSAHAIQIDGEWYDVTEAASRPVGAGVWGQVFLRRRS